MNIQILTIKDPTMDSQEIIRISHKAKNETEAFINRHLNDRAKGWPKLCLCRSADTWTGQKRQPQKTGSYN